jgi:hypothetical protein
VSIFPVNTQPHGVAADHLYPTFGDEAHVVERAALLQIALNLEQECVRQETNWAKRDAAFAQAMGPSGVEYVVQPAKVERVLPQNFFVGARPSLLVSSIAFWPSITVRCPNVGPSREQDDQIDILDCQLSVDVLCKAGPVRQEQLHLEPGINAEGDVNRQVQMLSAAVHMCLRRDPTFGGRVQTLQRPPRKDSGLPFAVPGTNQERTGPYYLYMAKRLRYVVQMASY